MSKVSEAWEIHQQSLVELMDSNDDWGDFLRWPPVLKFLHTQQNKRVRAKYDTLKENGWLDKVHETAVGNPKRLSYDSRHSGHSITTLYHIFRMGIDVSKLDNVFEFGGGYGCLCRLIHELGFNGRYIIYDLPVVQQLQRHYLDACGLGDVELSVDAGIPVDFRNSLFVSTMALNEAPSPTREIMLPVMSLSDFVWLAICEDSLGDAKAWFDRMVDRLPNREWLKERIDSRPNTFYLKGSLDAKLTEPFGRVSDDEHVALVNPI